MNDKEPFAVPNELLPSTGAVIGGGSAIGPTREATEVRLFRERVRQWASAHALLSADGEIVSTSEEGTSVNVPIYAMDAQLAVLRATARAPEPVTISVEPATRSWASRLRETFGKKRASTGDARFDERFAVRTSDEPAMQQILGDELRAQLLTFDAWWVLDYANGRIELRLDTPRLCGVHVLEAISIMHTAARSRVQRSAYR